MKLFLQFLFLFLTVTILHAQIPTSGQVSYYKFAESNSSSTTMTDENVNANNGTVTNGVGFISDRNAVSGQAVSLGGAGNSYNYITINGTAASTSVNALDEVTLSLWYKKEDATGASRAVWGISDATRYYELNYDAVNNKFAFTHYNGTTASTVLESAVLTVGTWYNIVMTISPSTGTSTMYINATSQGSNTQAITKPVNPSITLARRVGATFPNFPASFDDFYIYNRILTAAEITSIYSYCAAVLPSSSGNNRCGSGTLSLSASGATAYRWYADSIGGSTVSITSAYTTTTLYDTDTFYVANFASGCESKRVKSIATIKIKPSTSPINGMDNVASGALKSYSVFVNAGSTYTWEVINGTGSSITDVISVTWNTTAFGYTGYVRVTELATNGCSGNQKELPIMVAAEITNGLANKEIQEQTKLYPNPSNGNLTIETSEFIEKVILTNVLGQQELFYTTSFVSAFKGIVQAEIHTVKGIVYRKVVLE